MKQIYKYSIFYGKNVIQQVGFPKGARLLRVGLDPQSNLCVWALVDPDNEPLEKSILVVGTGIPLPEDRKLLYIGSTLDSPSIWHVFEVL